MSAAREAAAWRLREFVLRQTQRGPMSRRREIRRVLLADVALLEAPPAATGETPDAPAGATQSDYGSLGGHARAASLTAERRSEIARLGARARWHREA